MSTVDIYHRNLWKTRAKLAFAIVLLMGASLKIGTYSWKSEEIGLRMALGTQPAQVLGLAPAQVIRIVRIGVSLGRCGFVCTDEPYDQIALWRQIFMVR